MRIQEAWQSALGRRVSGVDQDFFELGGTSLKLLRLHALLEEHFPATFRVAQLFSHPTIARQARLAEPSAARETQNHTQDEVSEHDF
ncbi:acyl carrier protein [Streptomyces stramineus]